jgi:hypothetical protein
MGSQISCGPRRLPAGRAIWSVPGLYAHDRSARRAQARRYSGDDRQRLFISAADRHRRTHPMLPQRSLQYGALEVFELTELFDQGRTSELLFGAMRHLPGPGGVMMAVPRPEHLIAMKVQAMKDAPEGTWQDLVDIGFLLRLPGVDDAEVRGYFVRAGLDGKWRELTNEH